MTASTTTLTGALRAAPYAGYTYGYPHKTTYRPLDPPTTLRDAWAGERTDQLFGYLHLPFCEMRCGFCNLFTTANPHDDLVDAYLRALRREAAAVTGHLGRVRAARLAVGGGTPTYLTAAQLDDALTLLALTCRVTPGQVPLSVETSPATATPDRLAVLEQAGTTRISIGVQSFDLAEVHRVGRPHRPGHTEQALDAIRRHSTAALNIDLIYGLEGQDVTSWTASLRQALHWEPEEVFCYPLYVRPLTGIGRHPRAWDDQRLTLYRTARDLLTGAGYRQTSMRRFVRDTPQRPDGWSEPEYSCQDDGMLGLGCGARSYTRGLHWSREYAVGRSGVRAILDAYTRTDDFTVVGHGIRLPVAEQQRRFVLQSVLSTGLVHDSFRARFGSQVLDVLPQLRGLLDEELATDDGDVLALTAAGLELSDAIGPWLYSQQVRALTADHRLR